MKMSALPIYRSQVESTRAGVEIGRTKEIACGVDVAQGVHRDRVAIITTAPATFSQGFSPDEILGVGGGV